VQCVHDSFLYGFIGFRCHPVLEIGLRVLRTDAAQRLGRLAADDRILVVDHVGHGIDAILVPDFAERFQSR